MFKNIEMTGMQKFQVGFIALIFLAAGYMFFRNTRTPVDMTINAWSNKKPVGVDPKKQISAQNPEDPLKSYVETVFAFHDGQLFIWEYPEGSGMKAKFHFKPDLHRDSYDLYKDPLARVESISDPTKQILTKAAYSYLANTPKRYLASVKLDAAQLKAEKEVRDAMMAEITTNEQGAQTGTYRPELYDKVLSALAAFNAVSGNPTKDKKKAEAAHKVLSAAMNFLEALEADRTKAVDKYVAAVDGLLKKEQKEKLAEVASKPPKTVAKGGGGRGG